MSQYFKGTEKKPFIYPAITEVRKGSNKNTYWIIGLVSFAVIIGLVIFIFRK